MQGLGGILLLGVIQGLTEFLPVSSSGHLVIGETLLKLHAPSLTLDIALHLGTLLPVLWLYRRDVGELFFAVGRLPRLGAGLATDAPLRLLVCLALACVPTALIGASLESTFERLFSSARAVGISLIITGGILASTLLRRAPATGGALSLTPLKALLIGTAQGCAIAPGISRSGSTIAASLLLGVERELAARFSFLLSLPAVLGAALLHLRKVDAAGPVWPLVAGALTAAAAGYLALLLVTHLVKQGRVHWFALYVIPVGIAVLVYTWRKS